MTGAPRQARPQGRDPRINGDPTLFARLSLIVVTALGLLVQGLVVPAVFAQAEAQTGRVIQVRRATSASEDTLHDSSRDSLMIQIEHYSTIVESLRDSLDTGTDLEISPEQRESFETSISEISLVIERISAELSDLEFQIEDNTISLLDESGAGIIIRIPEDLDEQLSKGLEAVTEMVLREFPDSLNFGGQEHRWVWPGAREAPQPKRHRIVDGNLIKLWDDLLVAGEEDVRGEVVVVFGNAEIVGRVDGNVVVVFGDLRIDAAAEVTGQVIAIGGRLDQERGAQVGDVVVVDPFGGPRGFRPTSVMDMGWQGFLFCQGLFLLMLAVALTATVAAPAKRFRAVLDTLGGQPAAATGIGVLAAVGAHFVVIILAAVLVLTVIGLPLAVLLALAMIVAGVIATAVAAATVGELVCRRAGGCPSRWAAVLVGMVLLHSVSFFGSLMGLAPGLHLPAMLLSIIGGLLKLTAYMAGVGALAISRFGGRAPEAPAE